MNLSTQLQGESDDKLMWQRFIAGDVDAFDKLMSSHFRALFHYGSKFSRDKEFIKDSIQDLFLTLWEKRDNLSTDIAVKPYMMASLRRLIHRSLSSKSRLFDESTQNREGTFEIEFSVEQEYIENESTIALTEKLKKLLDELPRRQKEVIYLKFFQELDRGQISDIMEVSPQTVSNLLQIAIKQLQKHWRAEFLTFIIIQLFA